MFVRRAYVATFVLSLGVVGVWGQGRVIGPDWPAAHADAQLTSWSRTDPNISVENLSKPGFELQWKERVEPEPRGRHPFGQPITINGVNLFMPVSLMAGDANRVFAIDNDTGFVLWQRQFGSGGPPPSSTCRGGIAGAPARSINAVIPAPAVAAGGGGGRGGRGYQSLIGEPGQGAPIEARGGGAGRAAAPPAPAPPAPGPARGAAAAATANPQSGRAAAAPARGGGGGLGRLGGPAYVISSAGTLHTIGWINGIDIQKPLQVLPPNGRYSDAMAVNNVLYVTTSQGCGEAENAVWAVDLSAEDKRVTSWKTNGGSPIGPIAVTPDGTPLVTIGGRLRAESASAGQAGASREAGYANAILALDPKTLQPRDWFTHRTAEFVTPPAVFIQGSRTIAAAATRDGRVVLFDSASLGSRNHSTPLYASQPLTVGGNFTPEMIAVWQETPGAGTTWILVPVAGRLGPGGRVGSAESVVNGALVALRVVDRAGRLSLQAGWTTGDLLTPVTPVIVNGVVFAASTGRPPSDHATLYALDGKTGKRLWSSEKTIAAPMSGRSLWSSNSQVHVGTTDGTVYAFGFNLERK